MSYEIDRTNYMMLEFTSACNARCPACARTQHFVNGGIKPLGKPHLSMYHMQQLFERKWPNLQRLNIDGNYGDSMLHPQSLEFLRYIADTQDSKQIKLYIDSNGGYHDTGWWRELAQLLKQHYHPTSCVTFGIDGIDNATHQKYRVRVDWDRVMDNSAAFIAEGGVAEWKWIGFEYNDHQLEAAKQMAFDRGFDAFVYKNSRVRQTVIRDLIAKDIGHDVNLDSMQTRHGENVNSDISKDIVKQATAEVASVKDFANECAIQCRFRRNTHYGFQVEHSGYIHQCCHLPGYYNYQLPGSKIALEWQYYADKYSSEWNSLDHHSIETILSHPFFANDLEDSWNNRLDSETNPRIVRCITKCGSTR